MSNEDRLKQSLGAAIAAGMKDVKRIAALEAAIRYLWNAWSEAEGGGQPEGWVFGPDAEMRAYYTEQGIAPSYDPKEFSSWAEAPAEVQVVIREVLGR